MESRISYGTLNASFILGVGDALEESVDVREVERVCVLGGKDPLFRPGLVEVSGLSPRCEDIMLGILDIIEGRSVWRCSLIFWGLTFRQAGPSYLPEDL